MIVFVLILIFGLLRCYQLDLRPVHHDESINGFFVQQIWEQGWYRFDPANYHGPLHYYLLALSEVSFGWGIYSFRLVTVFFSLLLLLFLWRYLRGRAGGSTWFLLLILFSVAYTYYARWAIHETAYVFFIALALLGVTEFFQGNARRAWPWVIWGLWGMIALKETWVLLAACGGLVALGFLISGKIRLWRPFWRWPEGRVATFHAMLALGSLILLYSGFLHHPMGVVDYFRAFLPWTKTGFNVHEKPFTYWLDLLIRNEFPILIFLAVTAAWGGSRFRQLERGTQWLFLTAYFHFIVVSLIPYKTPWNLITNVIPCLLSGFLIWQDLAQKGFPFRRLTALTIFFLTLGGTVSYWSANYLDPLQPGLDYNYVHTDRRVKDLVDFLAERAETNPALRGIQLQVADEEAWPWAWWLSNYHNQVFRPLSHGLVENPDVVVISSAEASELERKISRDDYWVGEFPVRPGHRLSRVYIKKETFKESPFDDGPGQVEKKPGEKGETL